MICYINGKYWIATFVFIVITKHKHLIWDSNEKSRLWNQINHILNLNITYRSLIMGQNDPCLNNAISIQPPTQVYIIVKVIINFLYICVLYVLYYYLPS